MGGSDLGPDPYALLLSSLGACTSMTIRMYANRKGMKLDDVVVDLVHRRETLPAGSTGSAESSSTAGAASHGSTQTEDVFERQITLKGELSDAERQRLLEIADKCPVHKTLTGRIRITTHGNRAAPVRNLSSCSLRRHTHRLRIERLQRGR